MGKRARPQSPQGKQRPSPSLAPDAAAFSPAPSGGEALAALGYTLNGRLGEGTFSVVHSACRESDGADFAIKKLKRYDGDRAFHEETILCKVGGAR